MMELTRGPSDSPIAIDVAKYPEILLYIVYLSILIPFSNAFNSNVSIISGIIGIKIIPLPIPINKAPVKAKIALETQYPSDMIALKKNPNN